MAEQEFVKYTDDDLNGYTKNELIQTFKHFQKYRQNKEAMWKKIKKFHSGKFWELLQEKLPKHQIMPDTNYLEYVEKNIVNSVYSGVYVANVLPRHYEDNDIAEKLNAFLDYHSNKIGLKSMFPQLGSDVVLYNIAGIQVGWDSHSISGTSHEREQGKADLSFVPHNQIYLDPSTTNYLSGRAMFRSRRLTIFDLLNEKDLKAGAKAYVKQLSSDESNDFKPVTMSPEEIGDIHNDNSSSSSNEFSREVNLLECFFKVEEEDGSWRIDHIFIADHDFILYVKEDIQPKRFPIRVLYGEKPTSDPYGIPQLYKIMANITTLNMIDSLEATHFYNTQNRSKLVNVKSGINYRMFAKHGNTPHLAFPVHGNPADVVKYVDVQPLPEAGALKERLENAIFLVTGVDMRYIGRDTGSIQTTGGTDLSQQRIVSMTDSLRIINLERFVEDVTASIIDFYIEHGNEYTAVKREKGSNRALDDKNGDLKVDFNKIEDNSFDYSMNATPHLPSNKIRLAEAADHLMELQGQYQFDPPLITPEEWMMYKDFPQKNLQLQRMRRDAQRNDQRDMEETLLNFAGLLDKGLEPEEAIQVLVEEKQIQRDNPKLGAAKDPMPGPGNGNV